MDRRRLSEAWFSWKIRLFLITPTSTINDLMYFNSKNTEDVIRIHFEKLKNQFKNYWSNFHKLNCKLKYCDSISIYILNLNLILRPKLKFYDNIILINMIILIMYFLESCY